MLLLGVGEAFGEWCVGKGRVGGPIGDSEEVNNCIFLWERLILFYEAE